MNDQRYQALAANKNALVIDTLIDGRYATPDEIHEGMMMQKNGTWAIPYTIICTCYRMSTALQISDALNIKEQQ
ncbi:TPA: hypothetical protein ACK3Q6_001461 [Burkholderia cepacia]|uniref:Uncharacterized protein n=1 Tax=Burkholderia aenigmatica TaxID=2015348 RepID=A0A228IIG6_9BURK|nr:MULTISPECIES: hypothetical protein [Burkholderia cepacia complex]HDV6367307.1 hypothetical protein [Burkholderia cepacia]MCO8320802.1 hypothetical protein [Burkholderia cenocepacia]MCO8328086.1 hypothetical protein [Burkholderia cenocepacia]MCO8335373.1 hypothetical protein [Burkholderia cenocepacia]MCO8342657.1 hypothetical protein [Burkholderia cenocepacia]